MYKLYIAGFNEMPNAAMTVGIEPQISFLFDINNTDYANFKAQILAETAQLQDAEGDTMSAAAAKEFVATLP